MSDQIERIDPNVDPYGYVGFIRNPNGSVTRLPDRLPRTPAAGEDTPGNPFHLSKDIPINQAKNTWIRVFVPRKTFDSSPVTKLPIIVYFHAAGFVMCRADTSAFYGLYTAIVTEVPAILVSVEYRLAPEHRLPAAYDDCIEVLHHIKNSTDDWLTKYGEISKCFLMGTSSGGNICYHAGLQAAAIVDDLKPVEIKGLILHQAFFGGSKRADSELRLKDDMVLPLCASDLMWELALPIGADRDHEYSNPMVGIKTDLLDQMRRLKWKVLVIDCYGDPLIDRLIELVKKLEEHGVFVVSKFDEGGYHGDDFHDSSKTKLLSNVVKEFVASLIA